MLLFLQVKFRYDLSVVIHEKCFSDFQSNVFILDIYINKPLCC